MKVSVPTEHFSTGSKVMHIVSAIAFIVAMIIMLFEPIPDSFSFNLHQSLGMLVLVLFAARIAWINWVGQPPTQGTQVQKFIAHSAHLAMYAISLGMPLSGLLITLAKAKDTVVFGMFTISGFAERNSGLIEFAYQIHSFLEIFCYLLVAMHCVGTIYHQVALKDGTLARMMGVNKNA
ncbi:cytochrome b [Photobacterium minamisatsumaniensis]|uniref:cytochrome b n=1 Tax=Photobacterium minamisatsumaniensis TaxID=2910233 RepID=UPI003D0E9210